MFDNNNITSNPLRPTRLTRIASQLAYLIPPPFDRPESTICTGWVVASQYANVYRPPCWEEPVISSKVSFFPSPPRHLSPLYSRMHSILVFIPLLQSSACSEHLFIPFHSTPALPLFPPSIFTRRVVILSPPWHAVRTHTFSPIPCPFTTLYLMKPYLSLSAALSLFASLFRASSPPSHCSSQTESVHTHLPPWLYTFPLTPKFFGPLSIFFDKARLRFGKVLGMDIAVVTFSFFLSFFSFFDTSVIYMSYHKEKDNANNNQCIAS